jgi:hypothetical protein
LWATPVEPFGDVTVGQAVNVEFELENTSPDLMVLDLEFRPWSRAADGPSPTLGLDGLPPGEPIVRTVKLPPESLAPVMITLEFEDFEAFNIHEVQMRGDPDGTGDFDTITVLGRRSILDATVAVAEPAPVSAVTRLMRASPNPFATATTLRFELDRAQTASLRVYDVTGRVVQTLIDRPLRAGTHAVEWNGRTDAGELAPSGVYWMRLDAAEVELKTTVVRMR